jgi:transposase
MPGFPGFGRLGAMEKSLSSQATNWREGRRLRAWELHQKGWKQQEIAEALGVTQGAVSQWLKRGREGGVEGLRHHPPPGATPRLSPEQRGQLLELLAQGAESFGFQGEVWTQPRVATLIRDWFGVSYDPSQVGRILKACGWSSQKPVHRATQRDEAAIRCWKEERWPQIKKRR